MNLVKIGIICLKTVKSHLTRGTDHALAISTDTDFQIYLKHLPNSCFSNNYFSDGLRAWEANISIQSVSNHYKAVSYMCTYF